MNISRRKFLAAAPVVAGAVLQFNGLASAQSTAMDVTDLIGADALSRLTWSSFYPFINTDFSFDPGINMVSLKLIDMMDAKRKDQKLPRGQECFVLKFQGSSSEVLDTNTYSVNHFNLGDFSLFITDGGRSGREQYYVAVINRVLS